MANTYLSKTYSSSGNRQRQTISVWIKRASLGQQAIFSSWYNASYNTYFRFKSDDTLQYYDASSTTQLRTNRVFRDINSWYHIVATLDTTQSTSSDRLKFYVNGVQETSFGTANYPSQNAEMKFGDDNLHEIGRHNTANYFDGSMSHFHFVTNTAYAASTFGSTDSVTGEWKINTNPTVTYATNSFFVLKDGNSGTDQSGQGNNYSVGGGTLTKTEDCPSNVFATLNPLTNDGGGAKTYSFGNTKVAETANSWTSAHSTLGATSGKWYFEAKVTYTNAAEAYIGASSEQAIFDKLTATHYLGETTGSVGYYTGNGYYYKGAGGVSYGSSVSSGAILGCALDLDNNFIYFSINGTWQNSGDPTSGSSGTNGISLPSGMTDNKHKFLSVSPNESYLECNFGNGYFGTTAVSSAGTNASGNGIFEYDVPTGYTALSTKGLNL